MANLIHFNNPEFGTIRTIEKEGGVWFIAKDVCSALAYKEPHKAVVRHVDKDDGMKHPIIDEMGRRQTVWLINESGLYSLILSSKLPNAKKFKRWVTSEVLPTIRKTGSYTISDKQAKKCSKEELEINKIKAKSKLIGNIADVVKTVDSDVRLKVLNDMLKVAGEKGIDDLVLEEEIKKEACQSRSGFAPKIYFIDALIAGNIDYFKGFECIRNTDFLSDLKVGRINQKYLIKCYQEKFGLKLSSKRVMAELRYLKPSVFNPANMIRNKIGRFYMVKKERC